MPRRRHMTERELKAIVEQQLARSDWFENTELEQNRRAALDSYFGRDRPAHVTGRSNAVSMDVADAVEALTAEIMPSFDFDEIAMFDANGALDVEQAALESQICNRYLKINHGRVEIQGAIRNALLLRNGIIKVHVEKQQQVDEERYESLSDLELQAVQAPTATDQAVKVTSLKRNADDAELTDVNLTRTTEFKRLRIESIDPANFIVPREFTSTFLEDAELVGERKFLTRSQLVAMGFDRAKVDAIGSTQSDWKTSSLARNRDRTTPHWDRTDKTQNRIETFEVFIKVDWDNDGIAELRKVLYAGGLSAGVFLSNEPWPFQAYAAGTPFLLPNRFWGLSVYDKIIEVESLKSGALRQYVDNLENANFNELVVVDGDMNMPDAQARRPGGIIRADQANAVAPIPVMDTGTSSRAFLAYLDGMRSERVGASLDLQSAEFQIAGESAAGVERQISTKEQLAQLLCRTIGETLISEVFRLIHATLVEFMPDVAEFPVAPNRFVTATPSEWPARGEVTVIAGMSNAERTERRVTMDTMLLQMEKLHGAGFNDVLVNFETYHAALLDWTKAGGISSPRRYWLDPRQPEQMQAIEAKAKQAEQQQAQQRALEERIFATQVLVGDRDNATEIAKQTRQLRFDYWKETLKSEVEEFRVQAQGSEEVMPEQADVNADQEEGRERAGETT